MMTGHDITQDVQVYLKGRSKPLWQCRYFISVLSFKCMYIRLSCISTDLPTTLKRINSIVQYSAHFGEVKPLMKVNDYNYYT